MPSAACPVWPLPWPRSTPAAFPPTKPVEFENDTAGRLFYEALSKQQSRRGRSESKTEVSIPVVFDHKRRVVEGESVAFNEAVRRCDTNGDGRITELEARIFAEQAEKQQ